MTVHNVLCKKCGGSFDVRIYREYVTCPYCKSKTESPGFDYRNTSRGSGMYAGVKMWMDCPACRSPDMYLGSSGWKWKCPDCGYSISRLKIRIPPERLQRKPKTFPCSVRHRAAVQAVRQLFETYAAFSCPEYCSSTIHRNMDRAVS